MSAVSATDAPADAAVLTHLVLTKFCLPVPFSSRPGLHADEAWLAGRWSLFERFCLPSVLGRTEAPLHWLLLCWDGSPASLRERMAQLHSAHPQIVPVYLPGQHDPIDVITAGQQAGVTLGRWLLTTRLDSDDAVGRTYLARVQTAAVRLITESTPPARAVINAPVGYQLDDGGALLQLDPANPFLSLLEDRTASEPRTVFAVPHTDLHALADRSVQLFGAGAAWLQVVHGGNAENQLTGVRLGRRRLSGFAVPLEPATGPHRGGLRAAGRQLRQLVGRRGSWLASLRSLARRRW
jgi:hypothetical protein